MVKEFGSNTHGPKQFLGPKRSSKNIQVEKEIFGPHNECPEKFESKNFGPKNFF